MVEVEIPGADCARFTQHVAEIPIVIRQLCRRAREGDVDAEVALEGLGDVDE